MNPIEEINDSIPIDKTSRQLEKQASQFFLQGKIKEALEYLERAIQADPRNFDAYNFRGIVYASLNQFEEAISNFKKAAENDPVNHEFYEESIKEAKWKNHHVENKSRLRTTFSYDKPETLDNLGYRLLRPTDPEKESWIPFEREEIMIQLDQKKK